MTVVYTTIVSCTLALKRVSFDDPPSLPYICLQDYKEFARDLENTPEGYQSCHGVKNLYTGPTLTPLCSKKTSLWFTSSVNKRFDISSSLVYLEMMLKSMMQMMQSVVRGKCLCSSLIFL